ncbi:uncharacterized protein LAJ45_05088 [Morchella importuna]|nr:uncharacterized protein LAJ45_05088 [Morchella importuna]KAH8150906.1 hypothetical protein LAJ45_05088 [Morchella importuna]
MDIQHAAILLSRYDRAAEAAAAAAGLNHDNRGPALVATCLSFGIVMLIVLSARIYCRAVLLKKMGADDWCMVFAAIVGLGLIACALCGVYMTGAGKHRWDITWQDGVASQKIGLAAQIFYFISLGLTKASLLLFIIRLQPSERMIRTCWALLTLCTAFTISAFVSSCLQCVPLSYLWDQVNPFLAGTIEHHCVDQKALQYALPSINIATDFLVWLLPIKLIWKVQLPKRQKWGLVMVFSLGGLGVLAGILRLWSVGMAVKGQDPSWDYIDLSVWSNVEVLVSITCGSAPAARPFFSRYLPNFLGGTPNASAGSDEPHAFSPNAPRNIGAAPRSRSKQNQSDTYIMQSFSQHDSTEEFGIRTRIRGGDVESEAGKEGDGEVDGEADGEAVNKMGVGVKVEERV